MRGGSEHGLGIFVSKVEEGSSAGEQGAWGEVLGNICDPTSVGYRDAVVDGKQGPQLWRA